MAELSLAFEERLHEIEAYLDLLDTLEKQVQDGIPRIGEAGLAITVKQQRILYSSVYLQLYNLIESTIAKCIDSIAESIIDRWKPDDLSLQLRGEWVRAVAKTHTDLSPDKRLKQVLYICEQFIQTKSVSSFKIEKGGGGNWDEVTIEDIIKRMGMTLHLTQESLRGVKRNFRNDQGALVFIKSLRNNLAHGTLSFVESSEDVTVSDLRELKNRTVAYLREVVNSFESFIASHEFLLPERRPA